MHTVTVPACPPTTNELKQATEISKPAARMLGGQEENTGHTRKDRFNLSVRFDVPVDLDVLRERDFGGLLKRSDVGASLSHSNPAQGSPCRARTVFLKECASVRKAGTALWCEFGACLLALDVTAFELQPIGLSGCSALPTTDDAGALRC